jgi:hypothetical protein
MPSFSLCKNALYMSLCGRDGNSGDEGVTRLERGSLPIGLRSIVGRKGMSAARKLSLDEF